MNDAVKRMASSNENPRKKAKSFEPTSLSKEDEVQGQTKSSFIRLALGTPSPLTQRERFLCVFPREGPVCTNRRALAQTERGGAGLTRAHPSRRGSSDTSNGCCFFWWRTSPLAPITPSAPRRRRRTRDEKKKKKIFRRCFIIKINVNNNNNLSFTSPDCSSRLDFARARRAATRKRRRGDVATGAEEEETI